MYHGNSPLMKLTAGRNEISTEHLVTSLIPTSTTSVSQVGTPTLVASAGAGWQLVTASTSQTATTGNPPAITAPAAMAIHDKAAEISYAAPPGGWEAVSYPPDAGANLASYPAPPGGWDAIS